ncbi:MAG: 50S ribosomal protein L13 [Candidatus Heimdallarchaeota archaeon]|nr:50S ribosomal protein L13 [Candidatus Heimdallarchaeota archaeon]
MVDLTQFDDAHIIDAENAVIGRLASIVAKRLLSGEKIILINANKGIISGNPNTIAKSYLQRWKIKTKSNPLKGPFFPRQPDQILKRTVRGMLPYKKSRGKDAYGRLLVFKEKPDLFSDRNIETIPEVLNTNPKSPYITLAELQTKI